MTASGSRLFGSVVRPLEFYPDRPGSNPAMGGKFFQLCFIPLLDFHVVRGMACPSHSGLTVLAVSFSTIPEYSFNLGFNICKQHRALNEQGPVVQS